MKDSNGSRFDFKAHGYVNSADWARLRDLLPRVREGDNKAQKQAQETLSRDDTKAYAERVLLLYEIPIPPFAADEAATRNA